MKFKIIIISFIIVTGIACGARKLDKEDLKNQKQKVSYSIGNQIGTDFQQQELDLDLNFFFQGFKDGYFNSEQLLTEEERKKVMDAFQKEMRTKQAEKMKILGEKNKKEEVTFLAQNKIKEGVITLESGLQYKVINEGDGPSPQETDKVKAHYISMLLDGTEFDNSIKRGEPAVFPLNSVIPGWKEALQLMKVGAKWQLFVPSSLAYGEKGFVNIPPYSCLIFELELLGIEE